ncbi:MAG: hypothetical protein ACXQTP_00450 [Candidatus Methanofastidiosia archaeon]
MKRKITDLIKEKKITYSFKSKGVPTGHIGDLSLTNESDEDLEVEIPGGTVFVPSCSSIQTMMTGRPYVVPLRRRETEEVSIDDGYCADDYTKPPPPMPTETTPFTEIKIRGPHPNADIIDTVEKKLDEGALQATKLMKKEKAKQTLVQWVLWTLANSATFTKETAKKIIMGQFKERGKEPKEETVDEGIEMLFSDIALTVKETPSTSSIPFPPPPSSKPPCECMGNIKPAHHHSEPDIKISEHYKTQSNRDRIKQNIINDLRESSARVTPGSVVCYCQKGAAVGGYGDARAAYLFLERPGSFWGSEWLGRTELLKSEANGTTTVDITIRHKDIEGCSYEMIIAAAALTIIGGNAVIYDPLAGTEGGFRAFEILYDVASEFIEQDWITEVFDKIKEATTEYYVDIQNNATITSSIDGTTGESKIELHALLDREGGTMNSSPEDLYDAAHSYSLISNCTRGDHLQIQFEGSTNIQVEANDGGLGIIGQESLVAYVWYWACKTITKDEETIATDWGHDWSFTAVESTESEKNLLDGSISVRENLTNGIIGDILNATVGAKAHEDPFNCNKICSGLESALKEWIKRLDDKLGLYKGVSDKL